jgi:hypothetical protein
MKQPFLFSLAFALASVLALAFSPDTFLPPAPSWSGASEALIVADDHPWITPAEQSGLMDSPPYGETVTWLDRLAEASPFIQEYLRYPIGIER